MGVIYLFIYLFINWIILFYYNIILFTLFFLLLLFLLRSSCVFFYSSLSFSLLYYSFVPFPSSLIIIHSSYSSSLPLSLPIIPLFIYYYYYYTNIIILSPSFYLPTHLLTCYSSHSLTHSFSLSLSLSPPPHIYIPSYTTFLNPSISIIIQQLPFIYYSLPFLFLLLSSSYTSPLCIYQLSLSLTLFLSFLPSSHFLFNSKHSFPSCIFYWKYPMLPSLVCVFVRARHQCTTTPLPLSSSPSHTLNTLNHPRYRPTPSAYSLYLLPSCVCMFINIYYPHAPWNNLSVCLCVVRTTHAPTTETATACVHVHHRPPHAPLCVPATDNPRSTVCTYHTVSCRVSVCVSVCVCKSVPNNAYRQRRTTTPHI